MKENIEMKKQNKPLTKKHKNTTHISFVFFCMQLILFYNYLKQHIFCSHTYVEKSQPKGWHRQKSIQYQATICS
ncbi:hypothetical protein PU30_22630 [Escherichia coli]|nr:hypothetical protein PU30_22630 [Escherichia coli]